MRIIPESFIFKLQIRNSERFFGIPSVMLLLSNKQLPKQTTPLSRFNIISPSLQLSVIYSRQPTLV